MGDASEDRRDDEERLLVRAGWPAVLDRILAGLSHDLNGRVTALRGFLELAELGDAPGSLEAFLKGEVERLELLARTLWSLNDGSPAPELVAPGPFLSGVLQLHERHRGLETLATALRADREAPAFRASQRELRRVLLVALAQVAWSALALGGRAVVVSCAVGEDDGLVIDLEPEGSGAPRDPPGRAVPAHAGPDAGRALAALAELLAHQEIRLHVTRGEAGLALRLAFPAV